MRSLLFMACLTVLEPSFCLALQPGLGLQPGLRLLRSAPTSPPRSAPARMATPQPSSSKAVPTDEDLESALNGAQELKAVARHAREMADELAQMPFFKKDEQEAKTQRYEDAKTWRLKAEEAELAAEEARAAAELMLATVNEREAIQEAEAEEIRRQELGDAYEEELTPVESFNGGGDEEQRGADITGILSITMPTVVAVLALPALASWFNEFLAG